tara:strand:+ start:203 stop:742 length:540 start_codon:yes stop_codon:yes gene_type:complete
MRKKYSNVLAPDDVDFLINTDWAANEQFGKDNAYLSNDIALKQQYRNASDNWCEHPIFSKLLEIIRKDFDANISEHSYIRIEHRPIGHNWHNDIGAQYDGDPSHQKNTWLDCAASILLTSTDDFTEGDMYYADAYGKDKIPVNPVKVDREQYDMIVHSADVWHSVDKHEGNRTVMLLFV